METKTVSVKIIRELFTPRDSSKPSFYRYHYIARNGRKVDLRFKRDVDTRAFDGLTKFTAEFTTFDVSTAYEYPRAYAGGLVPDSVVSILVSHVDTPDEYLPD